MSKRERNNNVIPLHPSDVYDRARVSVLDGLEPVQERGPTILGGEGLTQEQIALFLAALASNKELWCIDILDKRGNRTAIFRGDLPPSRVRPR